MTTFLSAIEEFFTRHKARRGSHLNLRWFPGKGVSNGMQSDIAFVEMKLRGKVLDPKIICVEDILDPAQTLSWGHTTWERLVSRCRPRTRSEGLWLQHWKFEKILAPVGAVCWRPLASTKSWKQFCANGMVVIFLTWETKRGCRNGAGMAQDPSARIKSCQKESCLSHFANLCRGINFEETLHPYYDSIFDSISKRDEGYCGEM